MKKLEPIAHWADGQDIYQVRDGWYMVMDGWDGEKWTDCWRVSPDDLRKTIACDFVAAPIYRFEDEDIDLDKLEEGSDAWAFAHELVDFELGFKTFPIQHRYYFEFVLSSLDDDEILERSFICPDEERAIQKLYDYARHLLRRKPGDIAPDDVKILLMSVSGTYDADKKCIDLDRVILADDYSIM